MESVFIISDYSGWLSNLVEKLNLKENQIIPYESDLDEDWKMDIWVETQIPKTAKTIIIPIELGINNALSIDGLKIAMHLRLLNKENKLRYAPIIFISNRENWQITQLCRDIRDRNHLDYLIGTKGTDLLKPIIEDIIPTIANLNPLTEEEYIFDFYDHIKILQNENIGKHSIANNWGAFKLAEVTGNLNLFDNNLEYKKFIGELYFKYINAISNTQIKVDNFDLCPVELINARKKILLIDDQAKKGWDVVLNAIFKNAKFEVVSRNENENFQSFYDRAKAEALKEDGNIPIWDLILLDLRLDDNEDIGKNANKLAVDYSGSKLLKEIKTNNQGTQVIMFTASNKAWNMRELQNIGANGFYVKESPEYNSDETISIENFNSLSNQIEDCFKLGFLKKIVFKSNKIKLNLNTNEKVSDDFKDRTIRNLDIAFELFAKSSRNLRYNNYGYLQLFQIIEDYISLDNVFEKGEESFVFCNDKKHLVLKLIPESKDSGTKNKKYKSSIKYNPGSSIYELVESEYSGRIDCYFTVSALLIFRYGFRNGAALNWKEINTTRNNVAHGSQAIVNPDLINNLLEFIAHIINNENQYKEPSMEDAIKNLKDRFKK